MESQQSEKRSHPTALEIPWNNNEPISIIMLLQSISKKTSLSENRAANIKQFEFWDFDFEIQ